MIERIAIIVALITFGWAALKDVESRRVKNIVWLPAIVIAALLLIVRVTLVFDEPRPTQMLLLLRLGISIGFIFPLAYGFWYFGLFGGADARALMVLSLLLPKYPDEALEVAGETFPIIAPTVGVFSLSALTNGLIITTAYPLWLFFRNIISGSTRSLWAFVAVNIDVEDLQTTHGKLVETPDGMTFDGLDLDALRMYLNWRGITLDDIRTNPTRYRKLLTQTTNDAGDGRVLPDGGRDSEAAATAPDASAPAPEARTLRDDPWGAEAFLDEYRAYGTDPETLRDSLDLLTTADNVWVTPGIPLIVSFFVGLVTAVIVGDILAALLAAV